jgi:hypothetical protein
MYLLLACIVSLYASLNIDKKFDDILCEVNHLGSWNWSIFMSGLLMKSIEKFKKSKQKSTYIHENVFLLVVSNLCMILVELVFILSIYICF